MARRINSASAPAGPTEIVMREAGETAAKAPGITENPGGMTADEDFKNIKQLYNGMKTNGERYKPLWDRVSRTTGINVQPDYEWNNNQSKTKQLDEYVDDPTAALSVNQAGDYMVGIMWGTGEGVFKLKPSRYVLERVEEATVCDYYEFATDKTLYHMNHPDCGYISCLQPYAYDQFAFGNSGIGLFKNQAFLRGVDENCMVARQYGIDNTRIKEGKSGSCDYGYAIYHWNVTRIIGEFCKESGSISNYKLSQMPQQIQQAWDQKDLQKEFDLVFLWMPREDYDPKMLGRRGMRWRGVWFMDTSDIKDKVFCDESFRERPINWTRQIKVRGEDYGRSSGTLLLSTINSVNYMFAITQEILEKMADPALGVFGNAIFGDSVFDTTSGGMTIFNQALMQGSQPPVFPIHDVGDPEGIIKFLMPYLNEKIAAAFKIDALLDFNSDHTMSATESIQRYTIRGKSLSGLLIRQKNERSVPDVKRAVSICWECGELGVNPKKSPARAKGIKADNKYKKVIPDAVLEVFAMGKPWYEIEFNNELEKLLKTTKMQALVQLIQGVTAIAALYPDIIHAINWYQLLADMNEYLDIDSQIVVSEKTFKKIIADAAQAKQQMMQQQQLVAGAAAAKDGATAQQAMAQAGAIRNGQTTASGVS